MVNVSEIEDLKKAIQLLLEYNFSIEELQCNLVALIGSGMDDEDMEEILINENNADSN